MTALEGWSGHLLLDWDTAWDKISRTLYESGQLPALIEIQHGIDQVILVDVWRLAGHDLTDYPTTERLHLRAQLYRALAPLTAGILALPEEQTGDGPTQGTVVFDLASPGRSEVTLSSPKFPRR